MQHFQVFAVIEYDVMNKKHGSRNNQGRIQDD